MLSPAQLANDKFIRAAARVASAARLEAPGETEYQRRSRRIDRALCLKVARYRRLRAALGMEDLS